MNVNLEINIALEDLNRTTPGSACSQIQAVSTRENWLLLGVD
jgi:hypothetical protein